MPLQSNLDSHPILLALAVSQTQLEIKQMQNSRNQLPQLGVSYFNQSLVGWQTIGGMDQYFGPNERFQGGAIQTQIPIDFKAFKARNTSNSLALEQLAFTKQQQLLELQAEQSTRFAQLSQRISNYMDLEQDIEMQIVKIQADAQIQLDGGEISMIEFLQLQDYALELQHELLEWQHEIKLLHISIQWIQ